MSHERIVALIGSHKVRIARALARQMRGLSPNYASLEPAALEANLVRLLVLTAQFLQSGDDTSLKDFGLHTAQLRRALGFRIEDFMMAALTFLPVLRRFLLEHAPDLKTGLDDYEAFESVAIPVLAEAAALYRSADGPADDDEITVPNGRRGAGRSRLQIERVVGPAEDELTPFG